MIASARRRARAPLPRRCARARAAARARRTRGLARVKKKVKKSAASGASSASAKGRGVPGAVVAKLAGVRKELPGGRVIFEDLSLGLLRGAKVGVLGANGAGKSIKLLAGVDDEHDGTTWARARAAHRRARAGAADRRGARRDLEHHGRRRRAARRARRLRRGQRAARGRRRRGGGSRRWSSGRRSSPRRSSASVLEPARRGARGDDGAQLPRRGRGSGGAEPGGQRARRAVPLLVSRPELLLLDEPTNHLDAAAVAWLEKYLEAYKGAVVAVTHDRYFLDNVAGWILEVDGGHARPFEGNYSAWLEAKSKRVAPRGGARGGAGAAAQERAAWIRNAPKAGQTRNKARVNAYESLLAASDHERNAERRPRRRDLDRAGRRASAPPSSPRATSRSGTASSSSSRNLSFELPAGAVMGVVGRNGVGKTSLLRIIAGEEAADGGSVDVGATVALGTCRRAAAASTPRRRCTRRSRRAATR